MVKRIINIKIFGIRIHYRIDTNPATKWTGIKLRNYSNDKAMSAAIRRKWILFIQVNSFYLSISRLVKE
jgi:hypothetical protein